ncbi:patatin-like phospholipase family protein [Bradyrhizobium sp. BRP22]|uniref:patatin-like phospholipase family protein n=1 Tax=Bradyrhizobium sp. BRP22 TaxID=2793821 RepID=UPI001CD4647C|nr:patatin-like phospholipase family protein [Bradyrhizobium sp. BRP22]MCA1452727.1 patatin-like phospholipase family protein [Bradyrhizobium sp. BRP22]
MQAMSDPAQPTTAMVFSGGLGLAAYHAGAYETFAERGGVLHWVSGSSAGAITAALIAGNRVDHRIARLRDFWNHPPLDRANRDPWNHLNGWIGAIGTRLLGSAGHFYPRLPSLDPFRFRSFYDLAPMRERLAKLIDFGLLNGGSMRVCVATTDVETGEPVIFDSIREKLEMDHLLASCGFLPEFAAVELGGRLLGDGGLSMNAPFDPMLEEDVQGDMILYVIDLYARDGPCPASLEASLERKNDLLFGNQTLLRLKYLVEARQLRGQLAGRAPEAWKDRVVLLSYRPGAEEPGPEKSFDLSATALAQRWKAGGSTWRRQQERSMRVR